MRVLLVHNFYRSGAPSGEDTVYREERALLESRGIEVVAYERHSDELDGAGPLQLGKAAVEASWSDRSQQQLIELIERTQPTVAHFHNTFPLISPSGYAACRTAGVPVVQTLHNFRLICPGAMLFRNGKPCEDCVSGSLLPALRHTCYRDSLAATASVVKMLSDNRRRGVYGSHVQRYVALTDFARGKFIAGGLPRERIEVKPNALSTPPQAGNGGGGYVVYFGRLSEEKGVRTLLEAWRALPDVPLKMVGDGPLRGELEEQSRRWGLNVQFTGRLARSELPAIVGEAALAVVPSLWFEGFPMVVVEALACGTPVIASNLGSLAEIVQEGKTGRLFAVGNAAALAEVVRGALATPEALSSLRRQARDEFVRRYSPEANFHQLMAIYARATSQAEDDAAAFTARRAHKHPRSVRPAVDSH